MLVGEQPGDKEDLAGEPFVGPEIVVLLGATAAQVLLGSSFRVTKERGRFVEWPYQPRVTATVHPSSILRAPDEAARQAELARFVQDLEMVAAALVDGKGH
jgi:DNA polymerase